MYGLVSPESEEHGTETMHALRRETERGRAYRLATKADEEFFFSDAFVFQRGVTDKGQ